MKKPAAPALLIIDEATQHSGTDEILLGSSCYVVRIPKKMTHVFQPADQFVISGLKQRAIQLYNDDVSRIFARSDLNSAISNVICTSRTLCREKKVSYIVQAMQELPQAQIMASWEITEIPVVLFGSKKNRPSRLDAYKHLQTHLHTSSGAIFLDDEGSDEINTSSIGNAEGDINIIEENENSTASATIERSAPGEKRKRGRPCKVLSTEELELQRREAEDITNLRQRLRGMTRRQKERYKSAQSLTFTPLSSYGIGPKV